MKWLREIIDAIRWARRMMLIERENDALESKMCNFVTKEVWPASLAYKNEHGHLPKYLLLPMDKLTDIHRVIVEKRQYSRSMYDPTASTARVRITEEDNKCCNMELKWNGQEGDGDWSVGDEDPYVYPNV